MRVLGDEYIKSEFRAHQAVENPAQVVGSPYPYRTMYCMEAAAGVLTNNPQITFLTEWQLYAQKVEGEAWKGDRLDASVMEKMTGKFYLPTSLPSCLS